MLWLIDYAQSTKNELISVVSETLPHLKRGAMRDFLRIMEEHGYFDPAKWNRSDLIYSFSTGSKIEFFSVDQPHKVRGPRRDVLFVNEANNIPYETYTQLAIRTRKIIWLDWNPTHEFWWYTEILPNHDVDFITLTYKDNEALEPEVVKAIESRRYNKAWWRVYGEGKLGEIENRIYKGWQQIDKVPEEARFELYGLDFGYTNDPTGVVAIYKWNGGVILDEILYRKGLSNKQIADFMLTKPAGLIVADSAEPKSIDELMVYGLDVIPSTKGKDSVVHGIQRVQELKIWVTKSSLNLLKEYRNYLWLKDKDEKIINKPDPACADHLLDAARYGITELYPVEDEIIKEEPKRLEGTYHGWYKKEEKDDIYQEFDIEEEW